MSTWGSFKSVGSFLTARPAVLAFLLFVGIAALGTILIRDRMEAKRADPFHDALKMQLQAVELTVVKTWNVSVKLGGRLPQDLCIRAALSPDVAEAEHYRVLPPSTIRNIQDAIGPGVTVRPMEDCEFIGGISDLMTREGHVAWIVEYYDADTALMADKHRDNGSQRRWSDRDDFNVNRRYADDASVQVSNGWLWRDYYYDLKSSQEKVRIVRARGSLNLQ